MTISIGAAGRTISTAQPQATSGSKRLEWLDAARGIGIILVVAGHVERGLAAVGIGDHWAWFDFAIYSFHMPLFIFLAGVNVVMPLARGRESFLRGRVEGIAYPYLLWATLTYCIWHLVNGAGEPFRVADIVRHLALSPPSPFWFLYALFVFSCCYAIVGNRIAIFIPVLLMFALGEFYQNDTIVHQLLHFPLYFFAGVHLSGWVKAWHGQHKLAWSGAAICLLVVTDAVVGPLTGMNFNSVFLLPAAIAGIATILLISMSLRGAALAWMARLGSASMAIYVTHLFFTAATRLLLMKLHVPQLVVLYAAVGVIAGVTGPYLFYVVAERAGALPWLGLGKGRRRRA
jgi:fucose 4-O-acetylase-like acetyltransferase